MKQDVRAKGRPLIAAAYGVTNHAITAEAGTVTSLRGIMAGLDGDFAFAVLARPCFGLPHRADVGSGLKGLRNWLCQNDYDLLYLNSFFDREYTLPILALRRAGLIPPRPTVIAPHGEFSPGALNQKSGKKRAYISLAKHSGLLSKVWFHATGPQEAEVIRRTLPCAHRVTTVPSIRVLRPLPAQAAAPNPGRTRLVFLSRIDRKKNLDFAISVLAATRNPVSMDIYGPVTHEDYWLECQRAIATLPPQAEVRYCGVIPNSEVMNTLAGYDLFFLPTHGENFGHVIFDALEAGLPLLISDTTPWTGLDASQAGWSLPLKNPAAFTAAVDEWASKSEAERAILRQGARKLAERYVEEGGAANLYRQMFLSVMARQKTCGRAAAA